MSLFIYALTDPRKPSDIRYVGKTNNLSKRLTQHISKAKDVKQTNYCQNWIRKLLSEGIKPEITIICEASEDNWKELEQKYVVELREQGHKLTNTSEGGLGSTSFSKETREKISNTLKGRPLSEEHRKKLSDTRTGVPCKESTKIKLRKPHAAASKENILRGEDHLGAKLTAKEIIEMRLSGLNTAEISRKYNISRSHASAILRRKKWAHI